MVGERNQEYKIGHPPPHHPVEIGPPHFEGFIKTRGIVRLKYLLLFFTYRNYLQLVNGLCGESKSALILYYIYKYDVNCTVNK